MTPLLSLLLTLLVAQPGAGQVWLGFRGTGNSHSTAKNLPLKWSAEENVAWQVELPGYGQSSPVVWKDRVWVTSVAGEMQDRLLLHCLDLTAGKTLWHHEFPASQGVKTSDYVSKAAPTPVLDADRVYAFYESGDLFALDHAGKLLWQRSLVKDYGPIRSNHGLGSSPVLAGDAVIVLVAREGGSYLLAVDRKTGKNVWKRDHPFPISWSTPLLTTEGGKPVLVISASGGVEAFDAATGEPVWSLDGLKGNTVASPAAAGDLIVVGASERGSTVAIRAGGKGKITDTHVAWRAQEASVSFGSPLVHNGLVYVVNRAGVVFCLDLKSGKSLWDTRLRAATWASPVAAGDRVYFFSTNGDTTVLKAGGTLEKLAENPFPVTGRVYGVAVVDGAILLRTGDRLVRVGRP